MTDNAPAKSGFFRTLARFFLVRLLLLGVPLIVVLGGVEAAMAILPDKNPAYATDAFYYAGAAVAALATIALYLLLIRLLEGRGARELALGAGIPLAVVGILLGAALFVGIYLVFGALGYATWDGTYTLTALAMPFAFSVAAGVGEELIFRGGVFRIFEDSFGTLIALLLSAALFGAIHAGNPNATLTSSVAIAVEAGLLLALAYAAARSLWLPIGLHFAWNFTEGGVFGAAVSGNAVHGALNVPVTGPDLITGGSFGPEASLVAVAVCLALSLIFAIITIRSGRWKPLSFRLLLD